MKKILYVTFLFFISFLFCIFKVDAKEVNVYVFYSNSCPHCKEADNYLDSIKDKYELNIYKYEVSEKESLEKLDLVSDYLDVNVTGVPFVVINNKSISGYSVGVTDESYKYNIKLSAKEDFVDKVGIKLGLVSKNEIKKINNAKHNENNFIVNLPLKGKTNLKKIPIYVSSILLGIINGFNPGLIWVFILFLICINVINKKNNYLKNIILFLVLIGIFYYLFLINVLDYSSMTKLAVISRVLLALFALLIGAKKLNSFAEEDNGKIKLKKLKEILKKYRLVILFTSVLIFSIIFTIINLSITAGVPSIITDLLESYRLSNRAYLFVMFLYMVGFLISNAILISILVFVIKIFKIEKGKYINLIIGLVSLLLGILLVIKPDMLIF